MPEKPGDQDLSAYLEGKNVTAESGELRDDQNRAAAVTREQESTETVQTVEAETIKTPGEINAEIETAANELAEDMVSDENGVRAGVEAAAGDTLTEEERELVAARIKSEEGKLSLAQRIKKAGKKALGYGGTSFALTIGTKLALRSALTAAYGSSLLVWATAGAVAGAGIEGTKAYFKERKRYSVEDTVNKLRALEDENNETALVDRAALIAKSKEALAQARDRGDQVGEQALEAEITKATALLNTELNHDKLAEMGEKDKFLNILKIADGARKEVSRKDRKEAEKLIKKIELQQEKSKVRAGKVIRAAIYGAAIGSFGAVIGGTAAHYLAEYVSGLLGLHGAEHATAAAMEKGRALAGGLAKEKFKQATEEGLASAKGDLSQQALQQKFEAAFQGAKEGIKQQAKEKLIEQKFSAIVEKGDGLTQVMRKTIHDYIVNQAALDPEAIKNITVEKLVYMEDLLVKEKLQAGMEHMLQAGHPPIEVDGKDVIHALQEADKLNPAQLDHLKDLLSHGKHLVSEHTREAMLNFKQLFNGGNDHSKEILDPLIKTLKEQLQQNILDEAGTNVGQTAVEQTAGQAAQSAAEQAGAQIAPTITSETGAQAAGEAAQAAATETAVQEAAGETAEETTEAATEKGMSLTAKILIGTAIGGGGIGLAIWLRKKIRASREAGSKPPFERLSPELQQQEIVLNLEILTIIKETIEHDKAILESGTEGDEADQAREQLERLKTFFIEEVQPLLLEVFGGPNEIRNASEELWENYSFLCTEFGVDPAGQTASTEATPDIDETTIYDDADDSGDETYTATTKPGTSESSESKSANELVKKEQTKFNELSKNITDRGINLNQRELRKTIGKMSPQAALDLYKKMNDVWTQLLGQPEALTNLKDKTIEVGNKKSKSTESVTRINRNDSAEKILETILASINKT